MGKRIQGKSTEPLLAVEIAQLQRERSLAEAHARELAQELQQRNRELDDLEEMFSESLAVGRRDRPGIGSQSAAGIAQGMQLPSQGVFGEAVKAPAGRASSLTLEE